MQRGEYRYVLRDPEPEEDAPRAERFGWKAGDLGNHPVNSEDEDEA